MSSVLTYIAARKILKAALKVQTKASIGGSYSWKMYNKLLMEKSTEPFPISVWAVRIAPATFGAQFVGGAAKSAASTAFSKAKSVAGVFAPGAAGDAISSHNSGMGAARSANWGAAMSQGFAIGQSAVKADAKLKLKARPEVIDNQRNLWNVVYSDEFIAQGAVALFNLKKSPYCWGAVIDLYVTDPQISTVDSPRNPFGRNQRTAAAKMVDLAMGHCTNGGGKYLTSKIHVEIDDTASPMHALVTDSPSVQDRMTEAAAPAVRSPSAADAAAV